MKAKAPEKIYLEREIETDRIQNLWGINPVVSSLFEHIEYTRTDAFMEKADKFISSLFHPDDTLLKKYILDEFHKYIGGE